MTQLGGLFFITILSLPYLILIWHIPQAHLPSWSEAQPVLLKTLWQAFLSATGSLFFGAWGALGLLKISGKRREIFKFIFMLPNFLPSIFVVLSVLNFFQPFPYGVAGIVIVHVLINVGLVAFILSDSFENQLGGVVELAMIEGASRFQILLQGVLPMLKRDLFLCFITVFSLCFSSFAIPLILGGPSASTFEILIYQKIKIMAQWSEALSLSALQSLVLIGLTLFIRQNRPIIDYKWRDFSALGSKTGFLIPLFISALLLTGPLLGLPAGVRQIQNLPVLWDMFSDQILGSLVVGIGSGLLCLGMLIFLALFYPSLRIRKILVSYVAPSTALVGFSLLLMPEIENVFFKIILGFGLIIFPLIYRLRWYSVLDALAPQVEMGALLGAGPFLIFSKILYPQCFKIACRLAGLCAFWATGDFAISSIVADRDISVALVIQGLIGSYRIESASVLIWPMLLCGGLCYLFFIGLGYVGSQKSVS